MCARRERRAHGRLRRGRSRPRRPRARRRRPSVVALRRLVGEQLARRVEVGRGDEDLVRADAGKLSKDDSISVVTRGRTRCRPTAAARRRVRLGLVRDALDDNCLVHRRAGYSTRALRGGAGELVATGTAPRPASYLRSVRLTTLFAGLPFVGEYSMFRLSLISPDRDRRSQPADRGPKRQHDLAGLADAYLPLLISGLGVPAVASVCARSSPCPGPGRSRPRATYRLTRCRSPSAAP